MEKIRVVYNDDGTVTVSESYYTVLVNRCEWLDCLEAAGVDNWEGYDYAHEIHSEMCGD